MRCRGPSAGCSGCSLLLVFSFLDMTFPDIVAEAVIIYVPKSQPADKLRMNIFRHVHICASTLLSMCMSMQQICALSLYISNIPDMMGPARCDDANKSSAIWNEAFGWNFRAHWIYGWTANLAESVASTFNWSSSLRIFCLIYDNIWY